MKRTDESLQLFIHAFAARDLAEPLASFDDTTPPSIILSAIETNPWEVIGIREEGVVVGWLTRDDVMNSTDALNCHTLDTARVILESAPLNEVITALDSTPVLFVRSLGQIGGVICRRDLQKPAMRMWLFGLVTVSELRVTQMISEHCPEDSWQQHISAGRLEKAQAIQAERGRRGQSPNLLDCLQFADKGQIVARNEKLRELTRFGSKRQVEEFVAGLQDLRNNLAHAQDILNDWDVVRNLALNLHRTVLGPDGMAG